MNTQITYTGVVTNQVTGEVFKTRSYSTWEAAQKAAESLMRRRSVTANCKIEVQ